MPSCNCLEINQTDLTLIYTPEIATFRFRLTLSCLLLLQSSSASAIQISSCAVEKFKKGSKETLIRISVEWLLMQN